MTNLTVAFRNFAKAPENRGYIQLPIKLSLCTPKKISGSEIWASVIFSLSVRCRSVIGGIHTSGHFTFGGKNPPH